MRENQYGGNRSPPLRLAVYVVELEEEPNSVALPQKLSYKVDVLQVRLMVFAAD